MKTDVGIGQDIMIRSFHTIEKELKNKEIPLDKKWALLHAIHTTADFEMENILRIDDHAVASLTEIQPGRGTHHHHRRHNGRFRHPQGELYSVWGSK